MTDKRTILAVTISLALAVLGGMAGIVWLASVGRAIPEVLSGATTTALGALGALLVSTRVDPGQLPAERPSVADTPEAVAEPRRTRKAPVKP